MKSLSNSYFLIKSSSPSFYVHVFTRVQAAWVGKIRESVRFKQYPNKDRRVAVYLLEDVERFGKKGNIVWVKPGDSGVLYPKKQAIPARIIDPYLRGPLYYRLLENKLGALTAEANLTFGQRKERSLKIAEETLKKRELRIFPKEENFVLLPEDVSLSFRTILRLYIPRECIGELMEEGKSWPVREFGKFSFKVEIDPGVVAVGRISVEDPSVAEEERERKLEEENKREMREARKGRRKERDSS